MPIVPDRDDSDREIMTSLPRTRPVRRSDKRPTRAISDDAGPDGATPATAAPAKPQVARKPRSAPPKATTAPNGAAPREPRRTPRPKPAAADSEAASEHEARGDDDAARAELEPDPAAGQAPKRKVPAAGYAAPALRTEEHERAVVDLVTTTFQAANELVHIGADVGRAALRSILDRLPRA